MSSTAEIETAETGFVTFKVCGEWFTEHVRDLIREGDWPRATAHRWCKHRGLDVREILVTD